MHRHLVTFVLLAAASLPGCVTQQDSYFLGSDNYVLATHEDQDGGRRNYELVMASARGDASLRIRREFDRERPFLGLQVLELDKRAAEQRGVRPYTGLLVKGTYPKSGAEVGGVMAGDVLLSLDGRETVYLAHVADVEASLRAGQAVAAKVLRGQQEIELTLTAPPRKERVEDVQDVALEVPATHRPYAGVNLRGIPTTWTERIYGDPRQAIVLTNVEVGSPAWVAGFRGGDVIQKVDGSPAPNVHELAREIARRGEREETMRWAVVRGPGEAYEAELQLRDYSGETNIWFPLVFWLQNGTFSDKWSVGPFGLVMSNRNHYLPDSRSRVARTRNVWSALLSLIRVETGPQETKVRLLWLIHFDT
ncbi:MAG: hypothetical protein FJ265_01315 [Planctomycetes bacterium]|nr:hypothetical protein [Planctomycetota bacterium]